MDSYETGNLVASIAAQTFVDVWDASVSVITHGGWLLFVLLLANFYLNLNRVRRRHEYEHEIEWVFLNISIPDLPSPSMLAAELVFSQLHATKRKFNWRDRWFKGKVDTWFSFEIASIGGLVRYLIRAPRTHVEAVKSAVFAQYPDAEIGEASDYMEAFPLPFNPGEVDYDLYGTELSLEKPDAYPIRTYIQFEHRAAEIIIDPLSALIEVMSNLDPDEVMAVQIIAQPSGDHWKEHAEEVSQELKHKGEPEAETHEGAKEPPLTMMQHLSDTEKNVINLIHAKLGKLSYTTKIRFLYAAPKEKIKVQVRVPVALGVFSQFSAFDINAFKQNKFTFTKAVSRISDKLEARRIHGEVLWKKRTFISNFASRALHFGGTPFHLSTEEIASLFHFPLEDVRKGSVEKMEARKGEPPINLPV